MPSSTSSSRRAGLDVEGDDQVVISTVEDGAVGFERGKSTDRYTPGDVYIANEPQARWSAQASDQCAVRSECMRFALAHPSVQGIWGGTTDDERAASAAPKRKTRQARAGAPRN